MSLIDPHGGKLVNRVLEGAAAKSAASEASGYKAVTLSPREEFDLEMIAIGAFSPLTGFMGKADFDCVCKEMRLANGTVWPIPVTFCPQDDVAASIKVGDKLALNDSKSRLLGTMAVREKHPHDKELEIPNVYKTTDEAHPWSFNREGMPLYCTHRTLMNELLPIKWYGAPLYPLDPPSDYHHDPCRWYWYKDPADIPARFWERYGLAKP